MVVLSKAPVATAAAWEEDEADEEELLYGVLSLVENDAIVYFIKSVIIEVDGQEEEYAQICSMDIFYPLIVVIAIDRLDDICEQYGLEYQHLDEVCEENFGVDLSMANLPIQSGLSQYQMQYQQAMATDHASDTTEQRVRSTVAGVMALNYWKVKTVAECCFAHMDSWVSMYIHMDVFSEPEDDRIQEFFSQFDE